MFRTKSCSRVDETIYGTLFEYILSLIPDICVVKKITLPVEGESSILISRSPKQHAVCRDITLILQSRGPKLVPKAVGLVTEEGIYHMLESNLSSRERSEIRSTLLQVGVKVSQWTPNSGPYKPSYLTLLCVQSLWKANAELQKIDKDSLVLWQCYVTELYSRVSSNVENRLSRVLARTGNKSWADDSTCTDFDRLLDIGSNSCAASSNDSFFLDAYANAHVHFKEVVQFLLYRHLKPSDVPVMGTISVAVDLGQKLASVFAVEEEGVSSLKNSNRPMIFFVSIWFVSDNILENTDAFGLRSPWTVVRTDGDKKKNVDIKSKLNNYQKARQAQGTNSPGHATALIVNTQTKRLEYFEPNGGDVTWSRLVIGALRKGIRKYNPFYELLGKHSYSWLTPEEYNPVSGLQRIGASANAALAEMCSAYASLFILCRALCPSMTPQQTFVFITGQHEASSSADRITILVKTWLCESSRIVQEQHIEELKIAIDALAKLRTSIGGDFKSAVKDLNSFETKAKKLMEQAKFDTCLDFFQNEMQMKFDKSKVVVTYDSRRFGHTNMPAYRYTMTIRRA